MAKNIKELCFEFDNKKEEVIKIDNYLRSLEMNTFVLNKDIDNKIKEMNKLKADLKILKNEILELKEISKQESSSNSPAEES